LKKPEFSPVSDRFFYAGPLGPGDVDLEGPEAHHITDVRRFAAGDLVMLFNGDGREYPATITAVGKKRVSLHITRVEAADRELGFKLHIASALPKGDRGDFLIEKLTELGATDFTPLITERAVVKPADDKSDKLRRAVIEASKQCGRNMLMQIHPPARWTNWCPQQLGRRLLAHTSALAKPYSPDREGVIVAIGPEGGFTDSEVELAITTGWQVISLGRRTLRIETAAVAVAALIGLSDKTQ
jgi:16S rRNA (uracil1498-N3)-methyltransferase